MEVKVTPVPLYQNIYGKSLTQRSEPRYIEYRKKWEEQPKQFNHSNFPLFLDIEVTNICNLRCEFCATTHFGAEVARGMIEPEIVYKALDEGKSKGLYGVKFNDRGEPLLHPEITKFVRYAKECGLIDVYFNTNAMLLKAETCRELISSGLDRISISIEGNDSELYEKMRKKGKFVTVFRNVQTLNEIRDQLGSDTPKIRIQSVLLPEIRDRLDEYRDFWKPYADEISVLEFKEEKDADSRLIDYEYPWACNQLWQRAVIWFDGTILPCNEDDRGMLALGNIKDISIEDAWNSDALNELRQLHRNGKAHMIGACNACYLRDTQIKKLRYHDEKSEK